jgi:glycosyltransferase involved in cell wall biosynthesis
MLTIYIPTYNRPDRCRRLLESLVSLPRAYLKLISVKISDNASDTNYASILEKEYSKYFEITLIVNKKNIGARANIERGFSYASFDNYLYLIGDDDKINSEHLRETIDFLVAKKPKYVAYLENYQPGAKVTWDDLSSSQMYQIGNLGNIIIKGELIKPQLHELVHENNLGDNVWVTSAHYFFCLKDSEGYSCKELFQNAEHGDDMVKTSYYYITCLMHFWILTRELALTKKNFTSWPYIKFYLGNAYYALLNHVMLSDDLSYKSSTSSYGMTIKVFFKIISIMPMGLKRMLIYFINFSFKSRFSIYKTHKRLSEYLEMESHKRNNKVNSHLRRQKDFF